MPQIPEPIFASEIGNIKWKKIYAREYGVQYSEMALLCLSDRAKHHIPEPSTTQIIVPAGNNTAFFIDSTAWEQLIESLNRKYTTHLSMLEEYEKGFIKDGEAYLAITERLAKLDLDHLSNEELLELYREYQDNLFNYSIFAWTTFILNNYVANRAMSILESDLQARGLMDKKQEMVDAMFRPQKKAAVLQLQDEIAEYGDNINEEKFEYLYDKYRWLSCLDIHNEPLTRDQLLEMVQVDSYKGAIKKSDFTKYAAQLDLQEEDRKYLFMAQRFVYIKDARDDFRRQGIFNALSFFAQLAKRLGIERQEFGYVLEAEVIAFLEGKAKLNKDKVELRKEAFVLYLDQKQQPVCLQGEDIEPALTEFDLTNEILLLTDIKGTVASQGKASGRVVIVSGVEDLKKVKDGDVLIAVTTHPDYVPAMRRCCAVITDEGGITSHAAIVCREYGIPCIVNTKKASSVLQDGDQVEVDAIEGIVHRLD